MLYPYRMTGTREPTEPEEHKMLRLLGALTLGNMIFGGRRCHCRHYHHYHHYRHHGGLGRGLLLGTLLGVFVGRTNQNRTEGI